LGSGLLALLSVLISCTLPLVLRQLIVLIAQGNRLSLAFALLLTVLFLVEGISANYTKFVTNRYVNFMLVPSDRHVCRCSPLLEAAAAQLP
jgi:hypothetical protein